MCWSPRWRLEDGQLHAIPRPTQRVGFVRYHSVQSSSFGATAQKKVDTKQTTASQVSAITHIKEETATAAPGPYYYIPQETAWLAKSDTQLISQWDLAAWGFQLVDASDTSRFDYLSGDKLLWLPHQLLLYLQRVANDDDDKLGGHDCRLLIMNSLRSPMDSDKKARCLERVHMTAYQRHLGRLIVKHPSEWYYPGSDSRWREILTYPERKDICRHNYYKSYIDAMIWLHQAKKLNLGPMLWHLHPIVFLDALRYRINITADMLYKVFNKLDRDTRWHYLLDIAEDINRHADVFKLNTLRRVNHFFAQVKQEIGSRATVEESFEYSKEGLMKAWRYFRKHPDEAEAYAYK